MFLNSEEGPGKRVRTQIRFTRFANSFPSFPRETSVHAQLVGIRTCTQVYTGIHAHAQLLRDSLLTISLTHSLHPSGCNEHDSDSVEDFGYWTRAPLVTRAPVKVAPASPLPPPLLSLSSFHNPCKSASAHHTICPRNANAKHQQKQEKGPVPRPPKSCLLS